MAGGESCLADWKLRMILATVSPDSETRNDGRRSTKSVAWFCRLPV